MFVDADLPQARARLVTIDAAAPLSAAAALVRNGAELVVVCSDLGRMVGVISRRDIVDNVSIASQVTCGAPVSTAMNRNVIHCRSGERYDQIWSRIKNDPFVELPIVDPDLRPIGLLAVRQIIEALLEESVEASTELFNYVRSIGYNN
jgi:CBS domain-containing protein